MRGIDQGYDFFYPQIIGEFTSIPAYGLLGVNIPTSDCTVTYFRAHLGYNFWKGDSTFRIGGSEKGGLYWGLGGGLLISDNVYFELLYSLHKGTIQGRGDKFGEYGLSLIANSPYLNPTAQQYAQYLLYDRNYARDWSFEYSNLTFSIGIKF